jgi:hypothetical protein
LPSGIELKPGATKTAEDQSSDAKTHQIVTESKDAEDADDADDEDEDAKADTAKEADEPDDDGDDTKEAAVEDTDEDENLALAVQTELKRVGCYSISLDGLWGHRSQQALAAFGHFAHAKIGDLSPTADVLAIIKGKDGVVCIAEVEEPGPAPKRHRKQGYGDGGYDGGGYGGGGYDGGGYDGGGSGGGGY